MNQEIIRLNVILRKFSKTDTVILLTYCCHGVLE